MAKGVVDGLEAIEIDEQHGDRMVGGRAVLQRFLKLLLEQKTVAKPGERIVIGQILRAGLRLLAVGDLDLKALVGIDQTAGPFLYAALQILVDARQRLVGGDEL